MSNLPQELLDHIVDLLHDSQIPLENCCLVSKSWVPRTRRHIFAEICFQTPGNLQSWKKTFRDPSTSPARYTKTLFIGGPKVITAEDVSAGSWVRGFSRVVHLAMVGQGSFALWRKAAFIQFRGFSPFIKSLRVTRVAFPSTQFSDLILSFPLLEDLSVTECYRYRTLTNDGGFTDELSTAIQPSREPVFTGSLELLMRGGMEHIARQLLSQPGGIHFRKLTWTAFNENHLSLMMALVENCSHTLESLDITYDNGASIEHPPPHGSNSLPFPAGRESGSFNLSKAKKLRDVVFRPASLRVEWITLALQDVTRKSQDLRRISVNAPCHLTHLGVNECLRQAVGEDVLEEWLDLDRTLVHLLESLPIHTNVRWTRRRREGVMEDCVGRFFPEMTRRGMVTVNLVE